MTLDFAHAPAHQGIYSRDLHIDVILLATKFVDKNVSCCQSSNHLMLKQSNIRVPNSYPNPTAKDLKHNQDLSWISLSL